MRFLKKLGIGAIVVCLFGVPATAYAANTINIQLTQTILSGVLSTGFQAGTTAGAASVINPSFNMGAITTSNTEQTSHGSLSDNSKLLYVDNPGAAANWSLTVGLTSTNAGWYKSSDSTKTRVYYANGTNAQGNLSINPAVASVTDLNGTSRAGTSMALGTQAKLSSGNNAITIMSASGNATPGLWRGGIAGVALSQIVPPRTPAGTYSLDLTTTLTQT